MVFLATRARYTAMSWQRYRQVHHYQCKSVPKTRKRRTHSSQVLAQVLAGLRTMSYLNTRAVHAVWVGFGMGSGGLPHEHRNRVANARQWRTHSEQLPAQIPGKV